MRANIEDRYGELSPDAARLLRLLGLVPPDDVGPGAAAVLADLPPSRARDLLRELAARELLSESDAGRYRLPGPVRDLARRLAERDEPPAEREAALRRALDHHLAGTGDLAQARALLDRERWTEAADALTERLDAARAGGDARTTLRIRHDLGRALVRSGDVDRALELLRPLPDAFAALPDPDRRGRAEALTSLGEAYLGASRPVTAINLFGQALDIMRTEHAVEQQGDAFVHLADAAHLRGDPAAEGAALERAVELYASVPSPKAARTAERRAALTA
ncbi:hypothetical protein [Spirillospora albida]|uniref:hypothetical protein n=1 Tax=Spirillospora albida TaxID=58123 RepID=UPI0004C07133|nr:hypothetical protein [Spirillospora albida]